jgi:uncharacterized membrane protein YraQ (UPF0718 family)
VQGLVGRGVGQGPALGSCCRALSLPSILVIRSVLGTTKTLTYVALVVVMAAIRAWPSAPGAERHISQETR